MTPMETRIGAPATTANVSTQTEQSAIRERSIFKPGLLIGRGSRPLLCMYLMLTCRIDARNLDSAEVQCKNRAIVPCRFGILETREGRKHDPDQELGEVFHISRIRNRTANPLRRMDPRRLMR